MNLDSRCFIDDSWRQGGLASEDIFGYPNNRLDLYHIIEVTSNVNLRSRLTRYCRVFEAECIIDTTIVATTVVEKCLLRAESAVCYILPPTEKNTTVYAKKLRFSYIVGYFYHEMVLTKDISTL